MANLSDVIDITIQGNDQLSDRLRDINYSTELVEQAIHDLTAVMEQFARRDSGQGRAREAAEQQISTFDRLSAAIKSADAAIQTVAGPFASLANGVLATEAAVAAMAVAFGTLAVRDATEFADSMYAVKKQLGESTTTIDEARAGIEGLGLAYGINANEVAGAVAGFLAAGYDYETAAKLVEQSTQFMIAAELTAADSTEILNRSIAGFRIPADQAAEGAQRIGDAINKVADLSSGPITELSEGFARIAPTAKDAGLSIEETAAIIATMVDISYSGEQSSTALKSGLLSLLAPSKEAENALKALNVANTDSNGQLRSAKDILSDLAGEWGALTESQKLQTAAVIFGKEQAGAMSALLNDWGKSQKYLADMMDETTGAAGSMKREVDQLLALMSTKLSSAEEAWRQFRAALGAELMVGDGLGEAIDAVGKLGTAFKKVVDDGALDPIIEYFRTGFEAIAEVIAQVAANLPAAFERVDFSGLLSSLEALGQAGTELLNAIFGGLDLTTVEGLAGAIQLVVDSIALLTNVTAGILQEWRPFVEAIRETVTNFNELDQASQIEFGNTLGIMQTITQAGTGLGLALIAIGRAGVDMAQVLDVAFGAVKVVVNAAQVAFDGLVLGLLGVNEIALQVGLAMAELDQKLSFTDEGKAEAQRSIDEYNAKLETLGVQMDAVAANLNRNLGEMNQGWDQLTGNNSARFDRMRADLDKGEQSVRALGETSKTAAADLGALADTEVAVIFSADGRPLIDATKDAKGALDLLIKDPTVVVVDANNKPITDKAAVVRTLLARIKEDGEQAVILDADGQPIQDKILAATQKIDELQRKAEQGTTLDADGRPIQEAIGAAETELDKLLEQAQKGMTLEADSTPAVAAVDNVQQKVRDLLAEARRLADQGLIGESNAKEAEALALALGDAEAAALAAAPAVAGAGDEMSDMAKKAQDAAKSSADFMLEMEKIASNERIKSMEFAVDFQIAKVQADAQRVQAAFESIGTTVQSTGETISSLVSSLVDVSGSGSKWDQAWNTSAIEQQLSRENQRRDEALAMQSELAKAELERIRMQTNLMAQGGALINIQGDGLAPHLEAFMWEVLKAIQVRASADMQQFLLGVA